MSDDQTILAAVREFSSPQHPVYLVGGAVRDRLLGRAGHDLDFVTGAPTLPVARGVADRLHGGLYVLDAERDITRVVLDGSADQPRMFLDFSRLRAADLDGDLRARDFTINALALDPAKPERLIDPTGGLQDLRARVIRACSPQSMAEDPVRVLRGVRMAVGFGFRLDPQTKIWMEDAAPLIRRASAERIRDEFFRLLEGRQVALGMRLLDHFAVLPAALPELEQLKGVAQSAPHVQDVWQHTLSLVQHLEVLLAALVGTYQEESVRDLTVGSAVLWLGRYRQQLAAHFAQPLAPGRALRGLLFLAGLYHDVEKPSTRAEDDTGRVRFLRHEIRGAQTAGARARLLALSTAEINRLETIVAAHMRVHNLAGQLLRGEEITRRAIYRFFQDTGPAGVEICLLSLADVRATAEAGLAPDVWEAELRACRTLLEAYWEHPAEIVDPPRLLSGNDIMTELGLPSGPMIGTILAQVREAQAAGEVNSRAEALACARAFLAGPQNGKSHQD